MIKIEGEKKRTVVKKSDVVEALENGYTKEEIRKFLYPELNKSQWRTALQKMGLASFKAKKLDFVIEDEDDDLSDDSRPIVHSGTNEDKIQNLGVNSETTRTDNF